MENRRQKNILAINDISGFGKCSLTIALPIISACGITCTSLPTAVLSTHTGGFSHFTFRDLTSDLLDMANHWKSLNLKFDAIYTGYLGNAEQIDLVKEIVTMFKTENTIVLVDPVMADNGKFYSKFDLDFAQKMSQLIELSDIICPNITESKILLGEDFTNLSCDQKSVSSLLEELQQKFKKKVVITGAERPSELGAGYISNSKSPAFHFSNKIDGFFHGTGDIFASVLISALTSSLSLSDSVELACEFVSLAIEKSLGVVTDFRSGVNFESALGFLTKKFLD